MGNSSSNENERSDSNAPPPNAASESSNPSYFQMAKQGYQELVNAIIRPPRCIYELNHLGPPTFDFCGKKFHRRDLVLHNPRGLKICCSMWQPLPQNRHSLELPCVIYMHGNSSARLEALPQLSLVLSLGATFLALDFAGSGLSEGDYVSLGVFEKEDLSTVIEYLRMTGTVSYIALWGRSMGAATALLHGERDPSIAGMILDSSFSDLTTLAEEIVDKGRQNGLFAPNMIVKLAIYFIRSSVQKTAGFDIKDLSPIEKCDKCYIPAMFIAGESDNFVSPQHSQRLHDKYAGEKTLLVVPGDHNSMRPKFLLEHIIIFLIRVLQIPDEWLASNNGAVCGTAMPWQYKSRSNLNAWGLDQMQVGMTHAKQEEVQNKVHRVFGGGSNTTTPAAAVSSSQQQINKPPPISTAITSSSSSSSTAAQQTLNQDIKRKEYGLQSPTGSGIPSPHECHSVDNYDFGNTENIDKDRIKNKDMNVSPFPSSSSGQSSNNRLPPSVPYTSGSVITKNTATHTSSLYIETDTTNNNNNNNNNSNNNGSSSSMDIHPMHHVDYEDMKPSPYSDTSYATHSEIATTNNNYTPTEYLDYEHFLSSSENTVWKEKSPGYSHPPIIADNITDTSTTNNGTTTTTTIAAMTSSQYPYETTNIEEELPISTTDSIDMNTEWNCPTCTLINMPIYLVCAACGLPRFDDPNFT